MTKTTIRSLCLRIVAVLFANSLVLAACSGPFGFPTSPGHQLSSGPPALRPLTHLPRNPKIAHVVIIVQENRSVDNLFQGFPGADTVPYGYNKQG
ncbi:MAG TPA: hypothetical protein VGX91_00780, partial [Candidatus Cybelea sp.]|nr:hypothetical protein [Candidatus Cybelea sp.]